MELFSIMLFKEESLEREEIHKHSYSASNLAGKCLKPVEPHECISDRPILVSLGIFDSLALAVERKGKLVSS